MSYTAIVLDARSHANVVNYARGLRLVDGTWTEKAHHVTLAMGDKGKEFKKGSFRRLTVTHYGVTSGRVVAFRVRGAEDSQNAVPHVTVAVKGDAKPAESNSIAEWKELEKEQMFMVTGKVEVC